MFLYRLEYRSSLERMGVDLMKFSPGEKLIPTVYRSNYRDPSSFFAAQSFQMRHKDIIYVSNADAVEVTKFLGYVTTITSSVSGVAGDTGLTGDLIGGRHILGNN